jgi:competence protein ComEA
MPEALLDRRRVLAAAAVAVVALAFAGRTLLRPAHTAVPPPVRVAAHTRTVTAARIYVDVVGAVRRPGLYRVRDGARVAEAVARAGGATSRAQLELVNLAARVADGEQVVVPRRGATGSVSAAEAGAGTASAPTGPVHLSSATLEQLDALPGVGPVTAQKIVDYREQHGGFGSVDELDAVPGIGPARLENLRGLVAP